MKDKNIKVVLVNIVLAIVLIFLFIYFVYSLAYGYLKAGGVDVSCSSFLEFLKGYGIKNCQIGELK